MENPLAIVLICVLVAFIAGNFMIQTRRLNRSRLGKVMAVYRNVRFNAKLVNRFGYKGKSELFRTAAWDQNKRELDFLPIDTVNKLQALFESIYSINNEISSTVQGRGETTLYRVNVDRLKEPLMDMRKYLDHWIKVNYNNPKVAPKRPGFFGF